MGLLWANSRYYCTSKRIVTLFKEIANMIITACTDSLDPSSIFQGDAEEMHKKVTYCLGTLDSVRTSFEEVRTKLPDYFYEDVEPVPWNFHQKNVFKKLFKFISRLKLVQSVLETAIEYYKLEKVEVGGIRGRMLSQKCADLLEDFNTAYAVFPNIAYDLLDTSDERMAKEHETFFKKVEELDYR